MESLRKRLSGMDAAKGVEGQGRPLYADPWSDDGTNEPETQRSEVQGRMSGVLSLWLLYLCTSKDKVTRRARRNLKVGSE